MERPGRKSLFGDVKVRTKAEVSNEIKMIEDCKSVLHSVLEGNLKERVDEEVFDESFKPLASAVNAVIEKIADEDETNYQCAVMFRKNPMPMELVDEDFNVIDINDAYKALIDESHDNKIHIEGSSDEIEQLINNRREKTFNGEWTNTELQFIFKNNKRRYFRQYGIPIPNKDGKIDTAFFVYYDISDERDKSTEILKQKGQIDELSCLINSGVSTGSEIQGELSGMIVADEDPVTTSELSNDIESGDDGDFFEAAGEKSVEESPDVSEDLIPEGEISGLIQTEDESAELIIEIDEDDLPGPAEDPDADEVSEDVFQLESEEILSEALNSEDNLNEDPSVNEDIDGEDLTEAESVELITEVNEAEIPEPAEDLDAGEVSEDGFQLESEEILSEALNTEDNLNEDPSSVNEDIDGQDLTEAESVELITEVIETEIPEPAEDLDAGEVSEDGFQLESEEILSEALNTEDNLNEDPSSVNEDIDGQDLTESESAEDVTMAAADECPDYENCSETLSDSFEQEVYLPEMDSESVENISEDNSDNLPVAGDAADSEQFTEDNNNNGVIGQGNENSSTALEFQGSIDLVEFELNGDSYALDISIAREILEMRPITRITNASSFVSGIINLRGEVTTIINLHQFLNLPEECEKDEQKIIVFMPDCINGKKMGVIVDDVRSVIKVYSEDIEPVGNLLSSDIGDFIKGIIKVGNIRDEKQRRLVIWIDMVKAIDSLISRKG